MRKFFPFSNAVLSLKKNCIFVDTCICSYIEECKSCKVGISHTATGLSTKKD